jgi:hypothetical protein
VLQVLTGHQVMLMGCLPSWLQEQLTCSLLPLLLTLV